MTKTQGISPDPGHGKTRPIVMGQRGVVACGHYLAAEIGNHILRQGGNAIDAGVAMVLAESLLEFQSFGFGGEIPTLIYYAKDKQVYEVDGNMQTPKAATIEWFKQQGYTMVPDDGFTPAGVCAVLDALVNMLDRFGTMTFAQVSADAIRLASDGYPMYQHQLDMIKAMANRFTNEWPSSAKIYLPDGTIPEIGRICKNPDWANTLQRLVDAEANAKGKAANRRRTGLMAVRDYFYKGPVAEEIVNFQKEFKCKDAQGFCNSGLLTIDDFADYRCRIGQPVSVNYRGYDVYKCGPWTQGPVFLQQLNILEGFDLAAMGHNSTEYAHTWIEAAKLAHADKEKYYGDPDFVHVPMAGLLSKEYAKQRRKQIDPNQASLELRPGNPYVYDTHPEKQPSDLDLNPIDKILQDHGTTGTRAVDEQGNMFSATPSGGWMKSSPVIPGLGFCLGSRAQMFYLEEGKAKSLAPGKRPSTSLTPTLVMKDSKPLMVFGMPGGDLQDQGTLSCFLNIVDFKMDLQKALDAPKFWTSHFPSLFYPHKANPGNLTIERRVENLDDIVKVLKDKGHKVHIADAWTGDNTMICMIDQENNILKAATNPRFTTSYAIAF
jgi:gamma-glutamyltranspeptidase/glutathione hydrolase